MKRCLVAGPPKGDRLMRDALQPYSEAIEPWRQWRGLERIAPSQPCLGPLTGIVEVATVEREHIQRFRWNFTIAEKIVAGIGIGYGIRPEPECTERIEQFRLVDIGINHVRIGEAMDRIERQEPARIERHVSGRNPARPFPRTREERRIG